MLPLLQYLESSAVAMLLQKVFACPVPWSVDVDVDVDWRLLASGSHPN
jgi:hypothetical protein